ncbi:MAG: protein kinase [Planctomycetota bacterium]
MADSAAVVFALLELLLEDRAAGKTRTLAEYQALFPGHEEAIARELRSAEGQSAEPEDGRRIGPYRVRQLLGRGGQGEVFLAEDTRLGRRVALKVLAPGAARSLALRERFRREAEVASRLDHPGICTVYEAGEADGALFVAMRYVEGRTLAQVVVADRERGEEPLTRAELLDRCRRVEGAARALHAAHEAGVVHRDVKPSNLMLTPEDDLVVLDFGLAGDLTGDAPTLTATGDLHGTPAYMSAEQLSTERGTVDRRTDVYSLGVTLFELLAGRRPFEAPTREGLFRAILEAPAPALRRLVPAAPRDLETVLETALERERDRRYRTAELFADDLAAVIESRPVAARRVTLAGRALRYARREPAKASLALALLVVLLGAAGLAGFLGARWGELEEGRRAVRAQAIADLLHAGMGSYRKTPVVPDLEGLLREQPELDDLRTHVVVFCLHNGELERGLAHCEGATTRDGREAMERLRVACLRGLGRDAEADEAEDGLAEPRGPLALYARGTVHELAGRDREAAADFTLAVLRSPRAEPLIHFRRALALLSSPDADEALEAADTLEQLFPSSSIAWYYAGGIRGQHGYPEEARDALERSLELEPEDPDTWLMLGLVEAVLGEPDGVRDALERALSIETPGAWRIRDGAGRTYSRSGLHAEAVEPLRRALAERPELVDGRLCLGRSLLALGRYEEAATELRIVSKALPGNPEVARDLERALAGASE